MIGNCQYCGKECENVASHERFCGKNPNNVRTKRKAVPSPKELNDVYNKEFDRNIEGGNEAIASSVKAIEKVKELQSSSAEPIPTAMTSSPTIGTPDTSKTWLDKIMGRITPATEPMEEYKNFFGKIPKFEARPPGFFKRLTLKRGLTYKNFVFVDHDGNGEVAFLPYDAAKQRVIVDKLGYWVIDVKGDTIYLSKEKLLPLANVPDLSRFQNNANHVWSIYNGGIQEGITLRFDEMMDEWKKDRMFKWVCLAVAILALIALAVTAYSDGKTIGSLIEVNEIQSHQLINLTKVH